MDCDRHIFHQYCPTVVDLRRRLQLLFISYVKFYLDNVRLNFFHLCASHDEESDLRVAPRMTLRTLRRGYSVTIVMLGVTSLQILLSL